MFSDHAGTAPEYCLDTDGDEEDDCYVYTYTYTVDYVLWTETKTGYVYVYVGLTSGEQLSTKQIPDGFNPSSDLIVAFYISTDPDGNPNPVIYAYKAHKIKANHRSDIINCFQQFDKDFATDWDRSDESLLIEWKSHHKYRIMESAKNIDFDNYEEGMTSNDYDRKAVQRATDIFKRVLGLS